MCPRNANIILDEDGDAEDWIELYNSSATAVDLSIYFLSDDMNNLQKCAFPATDIASGGFLTVFASDKDKTAVVDHWETVVYADDIWSYLVPTAPVDPWWCTVGFDDSSWNTGPGGLQLCNIRHI